MTDLHAFRRELGGVVFDGGRRWTGPGPGHSRADRSLSVALADDGRILVHSFAGDPFTSCARHLGLKGDPRPASPADLAKAKVARDAERRREEAGATAFALNIWHEAAPIEGTAAEAYLYRRGLIFEGDELRFHPATPRVRMARPDGPRPHPAMIGIVRGPAGGARGIHLTYLTRDGEKAFGGRSRLMFGPVAGGAVRLTAIAADGVLGVAEGIETAGAFASLHSVTTWAALSTAGIARFELPPGVRKLVIAADSDDKGAGLKAAHVLAERCKRRCAVLIAPAPAEKDWADVLAEVANG